MLDIRVGQTNTHTHIRDYEANTAVEALFFIPEVVARAT